MEHPIKDIMADTLSKMKTIADSNTVLGTPVTTADGVTIMPVSKVSFGFVSGGSDFATEKQKDLFGGAASSGASITPVGFLVIRGESVRFIQVVDGSATIDRLINMMPELVEKLEDFLSKDKKDKKLTDEEINAAVAEAKAKLSENEKKAEDTESEKESEKE